VAPIDDKEHLLFSCKSTRHKVALCWPAHVKLNRFDVLHGLCMNAWKGSTTVMLAESIIECNVMKHNSHKQQACIGSKGQALLDASIDCLSWVW
jgi:hypothetical protein